MIVMWNIVTRAAFAAASDTEAAAVPATATDRYCCIVSYILFYI